MRRSEREITRFQDILAVLDKCQVMHLGLSDGGKPYVVAMNFGYAVEDGDKLALYFHCAKEGKKLEILARNPAAAFQAECSYQPVGGPEACSWTARYESVMGSGTLGIVWGEAETVRGMNCLMERLGVSGTPVYSAQTLSRVCVLRLDVDEITGKRNMG